jgi:putative membrane protein
VRVPVEARFPLLLLAGFIVVFVTLGIASKYRQDWLLENVLVVITVPALVIAWRNLRFSNAAYACLFVFFVLHEIGAHYTYSEVPYDAWAVALTGHSVDAALGFERNHYDRLVHFLYGVLLMPATVELFRAKAPPRGVWIVLMPVFFIMSHSVLYEMIEWLAAEAFGGDLGQAYLGTQGDIWDAQKDMALATAGALLARLAMLAIDVRRIRSGA